MEQPASSSSALAPRRAKLVIGALVVVVSLFGLVGWAMGRPGSTSFYLTTSELVAKGATPAGQDYRVNGKVVPGSIHHQGLRYSFALSDGKKPITVVTSRPLPDTFKPHADVVARGRYNGARFTASEVLAKCPSKFKPQD